MLRLFILLLSCAAVCAQPVLSLNDPTVAAKSSSLLQGLQGYWQLEESSGTRYDRSPYGNHLTAVNSPGSATGKVGNSAKFTNTSIQYLSINNNSSIQLATNDFTVSLWVNFSAISSTGNWLANKRGSSSNFEWQMLYSKSSNGIYFEVGNANASQSAAAIFSITNLNTWIFAAGRWDNANKIASLTVNDSTIYATNANVTTSVGTNGLSIGAAAWFQSTNTCHSGSIDEVGLWKRKLTDSQVSTLYRSGLGVTYPRFSMRDNRADDFNWDNWEPLYDKPKPFPTLYAFVNRREPEPLLTLCE